MFRCLVKELLSTNGIVFKSWDDNVVEESLLFFLFNLSELLSY
jgi:hypothetical protein